MFLLAAALTYAELGWQVFPCNPLNKRPLTEHGLKDATVDEATITMWWRKWPGAMIAVATGIQSDLVVLDVDVDTTKGINGEKALAGLLNGRSLPEELTAVRTPRGGRHIYFAYPKGRDVRNSAGKLGKGLDVRANGGYVICPPSVNGDGIAYRWDPEQWGVLHPTPEWLLSKPAQPLPREIWIPKSAGSNEHRHVYGDAALKYECDAIATKREGQRNDQLFRSACRLFELVAGEVLGESEVREALLAAANACGLPATEAERTIESAYAHGSQNPRSPMERADRDRLHWLGQEEGDHGANTGNNTNIRYSDYGRDKGPNEQKSAPFRFLLYRDFSKDCEKEWQVENLLGTGEFSCFFGEPSAGKSVLVEDMLLHAAAGREWHGRRMKGGLAVFFALERHQVVIRRARAFEIRTGLTDLPFVVVPGPINFVDWRTSVPRIFDTIHRAEDTYSMGLSLLAIDTVSAALFGGDENSPKEMGSFINSIRHIQERASGHIVVVHHQPHDAARLRGHGALLGAVDLTAQVVKANGVHQLIVRKINDGPEDQTISFALESIDIHTGPDGTQTTAPVVVPVVGAATSKADKKAKLTAGAKIALHALEEALAEISRLPQSTVGIPENTKVVTTEQWRQFAYKRGIAPGGEKEAQQKAFRRAHERLVADKLVGVMEPYVWRVW